MAKVYAMIADGTEEVECLTVVDLLRRAGVEVELVSVCGLTVTSSHGVKITADDVVENVELTNADMIFVPGGMPGTQKLAECGKLIDAIRAMSEKEKRVAAVCAAPALVLGANGFLDGKSAVCFPEKKYEDKMLGATISVGSRVVTDGNITTSRGLGCCIDLGLELVKLLVGAQAAAELAVKIQK